jgi:hypothetical protein
LLPRRQQPQRQAPSVFSFGPPRRQPVKQAKPGLMSHFQTSEGSFDIMKIAGKAQQAKKMYDQVSPFVGPYVIPLITRFLKK